MEGHRPTCRPRGPKHPYPRLHSRSTPARILFICWWLAFVGSRRCAIAAAAGPHQSAFLPKTDGRARHPQTRRNSRRPIVAAAKTMLARRLWFAYGPDSRSSSAAWLGQRLNPGRALKGDPHRAALDATSIQSQFPDPLLSMDSCPAGFRGPMPSRRLPHEGSTGAVRWPRALAASFEDVCSDLDCMTSRP